MARRAASMFVAFESLTNRTPPISATGSSACSRPVNPSTALTIAAASTPTSDATAAAATRRRRRCRPSSCTDVSGTSGSSPVAVFAERWCLRRSGRCPRRFPRSSRTAAAAARPRAASSSAAGSSALRTAQSEDSGSRRSRAFASAYSCDARVPIEMVGREVEEHRDPRPERLDALELKAARLDDVNRLVGRHVDLRAQREADVAADEHVVPARFEHPPGQRRRRRLPFRAGDGDDPAAQPAATPARARRSPGRRPRAPPRSPDGIAEARPGSARSDPRRISVAARWPPSSSATPAPRRRSSSSICSPDVGQGDRSRRGARAARRRRRRSAPRRRRRPACPRTEKEASVI